VTLFGTALNAAATYKTSRPSLNILRADINNSGTITNADVSRFGEILNNVGISGSGSVLDGGSDVPEPASCLLALLGFAFAASVRRRSR
jgi:MYXO-CTERM domain-containing protein